jgi:hypothetical protein
MHAAETEIIIEAGHTERDRWRDLFRYRELFHFLAWRDILVRYKQTVIGVLWAVLRPLLTMLVFVLSDGIISGEEDLTSDLRLQIYDFRCLTSSFAIDNIRL